ERIIAISIGKLKQRQGEKQRIDQREHTKFERRQAVTNNELVKLEKSKYVPNNPRPLPKEPVIDGKDRLTKLRKAPGSTEKNPKYEEYTSAQVRKEFFEKIK